MFRIIFIIVLLTTNYLVSGQRLSLTEERTLRGAMVSFNRIDEDRILSSLRSIVNNKSVVAIGEVTHGTQEVDQLQLAVARFLLHYDFRAVALGELSISSTWLLNEYVLSGRHTAQQAIQLAFKYQYGGTSADMLNFVEWLRSFNESRPLKQRIWLIGTEIGPPDQLAQIALNYSQKLAVTIPDTLQETLTELLTVSDTYKARRGVDQLTAKTRQLANWLVARKNTDTLSLEQQWQQQCIRQLPEAVETFCRPTQAYRDKGIYTNIRWLKERRPETKLVIIDIHNVHIEKRPCYNWEHLNRAGYWLDSAHQQQYLAIATEVGYGTYKSGNEDGIKLVRVPESRYKLGTLLCSITPSSYGLIRTNTSPDLIQFFRKFNRLTYGTSDQGTGMTWPCAGLPDAFDALLYSRVSTPTQFAVVGASSTFTLYLNLTDSLKQHLLKSSQFTISLRINLTKAADTDPFPRMTIYFHDKRKKQLGSQVWPINSSGNNNQSFDIPPKTRIISIGVHANKVSSFALEQFTINGQPIPMSLFSFHDWSQNSESNEKFGNDILV